MNQNNTCCIIVTYNPSRHRILETISSVLFNGVKVILVDNGSANILEFEREIRSMPGVDFMPLGENLGIAKAQNLGIASALKDGFDFIWLSDQDTTYPTDYVEKMGRVLLSISDEKNLAALGPLYVDTNQGTPQLLVRYAPFKQTFAAEKGINEVDEIIASGTVIPSSAIKKVGLMNENLFIDMVDLEWCWRAKRIHKMRILVAAEVCITHTLGDVSIHVRGKTFVLRSPIRHYYMVRNTLALSLYSRSLSMAQKVEFAVKAIRWAFIYPLAVRERRLTHLSRTLLGLAHGLVNRLGPL